MTDRTDNSVMFALEELRKLESDRRADEERREREAAEARAQARMAEREEQEHARRVAEAEARLRVEQELRARDAEAERRLQMLRAELDAVRADRERIHATVSRLNDDDLPVTARRRPSGWALAFGGAALVAAGLAFALVSRPPAGHEPIAQVPTAAPQTSADVAATAEPAPSDETTSGAEPDTAADAPEPDTGPTQVATAPSPSRPQGGRPTTTRPTDTDRPGMHGTETMDSALDFDHCGADPTCGLELDP